MCAQQVEDRGSVVAVLVPPRRLFQPPHERYSDISFVVDGVTFRMHKYPLLKQASPFFEQHVEVCGWQSSQYTPTRSSPTHTHTSCCRHARQTMSPLSCSSLVAQRCLALQLASATVPRVPMTVCASASTSPTLSRSVCMCVCVDHIEHPPAPSTLDSLTHSLDALCTGAGSGNLPPLGCHGSHC